MSYFTFRGKSYKRLSARCFTRIRRILFRHPHGGIISSQDSQFLHCLIDNKKFSFSVDEISVVVDESSRKRSFSIVLKDGSTIDFRISCFLESIPRQGNTANYDDYLLSDDWQFKRLQVFERDGWVCISCNQRASDVHHKTYNNFGDESLDDLQTVCRSCHQDIHERLFYEPKS